MVRWLNRCVIMGKIASEVNYRAFENPDGGEPHLMADFLLCNIHGKSGGSFRRSTILVRAYAGHARHMKDWDLKRADYVLVEGQWRTYRSKKGYRDYLRVDNWQGLHPPPSQFRKGHALVPLDELRRMQRLTANTLDFELPPDTLAAFGLQAEATSYDPGDDGQLEFPED